MGSSLRLKQDLTFSKEKDFLKERLRFRTASRKSQRLFEEEVRLGSQKNYYSNLTCEYTPGTKERQFRGDSVFVTGG